MPRTRVLLPTVAFVLAACDTTPAPTDPAASARPAPAANLVLFPRGYVATRISILPVAINDSGVIAGHVDYKQAALYHNGTRTILRSPSALGVFYQATAINRRAVTVGLIPSGPGLYWYTPTSAPLVIVAPGGVAVRPRAINNSDVVVGTYGNRAFRWTAYGGFQDITPPGYLSVDVTDINDNGYVVGRGVPATGEPRALRWAPGAGAAAVALPGANGQAVAIRNNGDAIGTATVSPYLRMWTLSGQVHPVLGPTSPASDLADISAAGRVAGMTKVVQYDRPWTSFQGTLTMLPLLDLPQSSGWVTGMNGCGSIVGQQAYGPTQDVAGVLWTKSTCDLAGAYVP